MLIHRVELENIKSFEAAVIDLAPGLTAIVGENGAGKSTILEAIGWGLFGYLAHRRRADFMRHGAQHARLAVEFTSDHDGRRYRVSRSLHRSRSRTSGALSPDVQSATAVLDVELDRTFEQRADDVQAFLASHLRAEGFDSPADVFEHVVGVPQGRLTADFIDPPRIRKERFDPILRTAEFQRAVEGLLPVVQHFRDRRAEHAEAIAALKVRVDRRDDVQSRLEAAERAFHEVTHEVDRARRELEREEAEVARGDELRLAREASVRALDTARAHREHARSNERGAAERAARADAAAGVVARAEPGYLAHQAAREELASLAGARADHEARQRGLAERRVAVERARIDFEAAAAALAEVEQAHRALDALERDAALEASLTTHIDLLRREQAVAESVAERADDAERALGGADAKLRDALDRIDAAAWETAAARDATADEAAAAAAQAGVAQESGRRRARLRELQAEQATLTATLEADHHAHDLLSRTRACPFFERECRNLSDVSDLDGVFAGRAAGHRRRLDELAAALEATALAVTEADAAAVEAGRVLDLEARRDRHQSALDRLHAEGAWVRDVAAATTDRNLAAVRQTLDARAPEALPAASLAELDAVQALLTPLGEDVARALGDLERASAARLEVQRLATELDSLQSRLFDVRGHGYKLREQREIASLLDERRARRAEARRRLESERGALSSQEAAAQSLAPRLDRIRELESRIEEVRDDHERYLEHRGAASELERRRADRLSARVAVGEAEAAVAAARADFERAEAGFDPAALQAARGRRDRALGKTEQLKERTAQTRAQVDELRQDLTALDGVAEELAARRAGLARDESSERLTEFLRDVLRRAGPFVTESLLADVSAGANQLFAQILGDDRARLTWAPDYDILLRQDGSERAFSQLSGGEQMSAALAVRLALLRELLHFDVAFFDEPTQHLDEVRRANLAEQIQQVTGFSQLVVITHDDTFERLLDSVIHVRKVDGRSVVEAA